jgi:hypothetical protein
VGGNYEALLFSSGPCLGHIPTIVIDMESLAGSNDLSVLYPDLLRHIFLKQLETGEIGWESSP